VVLTGLDGCRPSPPQTGIVSGRQLPYPCAVPDPTDLPDPTDATLAGPGHRITLILDGLPVETLPTSRRTRGAFCSLGSTHRR